MLGRTFTVILQLAVGLLLLLTTIVALPALTAVTLPFSSTVATRLLVEVNVRVLLEAFSGRTFVAIVKLPPILRNFDEGVAVTAVTKRIIYL